MTIENKIHCDGCSKTIETDCTDSVNELLAQNGWEHDPLTEEYQYCGDCLPKVKQEYDELKVTRS